MHKREIGWKCKTGHFCPDSRPAAWSSVPDLVRYTARRVLMQSGVVGAGDGQAATRLFYNPWNLPALIQTSGATLFAVADLHTFSIKFFDHLTHTQPRHSGIWHLAGSEVVFGFWALVLNQACCQDLGCADAARPLFCAALSE